MRLNYRGRSLPQKSEYSLSIQFAFYVRPDQSQDPQLILEYQLIGLIPAQPMQMRG